MNEYREWIAHSNDFSNFYVSLLNDGFNGLHISLKSEIVEDKQMEIFFTNYVSYRMIEESAFLKELGAVGIFKFSKINQSKYLQWFKDESLDAFRHYELNHYFIYGTNKVIEIIAGAEPTVEYT
jgi:hypothetical protein